MARKRRGTNRAFFFMPLTKSRYLRTIRRFSTEQMAPVTTKAAPRAASRLRSGAANFAGTSQWASAAKAMVKSGTRVMVVETLPTSQWLSASAKAP